MTSRGLTILLRDDEAEALSILAERARRFPRQQAQWIIAKAAADAGLLENESGDGATVQAATVTRSSPQMAAA